MTGAIIAFLIFTTVMTAISVTALKDCRKIKILPTHSQFASYSPSNTLKDRSRATITLPLSDNDFPSGSDRKYAAIFKKENIPLIGIAVGMIAFSFQLSVLYPWHVELHGSFSTLEVRLFLRSSNVPCHLG